MTFVPASIFTNAFTCPWCNAFAHQVWGASDLSFHISESTIGNIELRREKGTLGFSSHNYGGIPLPLRSACCQQCKKYSIWMEDEMIFPDKGSTATKH